MTDNPQDKPKIIVDEDWKTQVQDEMDQLRQEPPKPSPAGEPVQTGDTAPAPAASPAVDRDVPTPNPDTEAEQPMQIPPASFSVLVQSLATQTVVALGRLPDHDGNPMPAQPDLARHFVDSLAMLEEKTKGNLTADEQALLSGVLHELRMLFITSESGAGPSPGEIRQ